MSNVPISPEEVKNSRKNIDTTATLQFPSDLSEIGTLLLFKEYSYGDRDLGGRGGLRTRPNAEIKLTGSLYLPLPEQMLDSTNVKVAGTELGLAGNFTSQAAQTLSGNSLDGIAENIKKTLGALNTREFASSAGAAMAKQFLTAVGFQGAQQGIEVGLGATFNPYAALTFEGVNLKNYTWNWVLAPRTRGETDTLHAIIKQLKINSLPYYKSIAGSSGRVFLGYPNVCLPIIAGVNTLVMKPCMVSNINVDYGGGGELAFLEGGDPAIVKIELTLQEMQIWTREDYV
mgnify:FL=1|tara:strand:- start:481 stop:1341 length:861 start_codon:yes stop_codon:yes gene_type:complete